MYGIINIYINYFPEHKQDPQQLVDLFLKNNQRLIEQIRNQTGYEVLIVPTTKEASRVEKIDFSKPFPTCHPASHFDLAERE